MRSSVSVILSTPAPESSMSHPDYEQTAHDHSSILILVKSIGKFFICWLTHIWIVFPGAEVKPKLFNRVYDKVCRINRIKLNDSSGSTREISARFVKDYPVENNDWGDFQTHRRLLGLITVGRCSSQIELNEICRIHESLKAKYVATLYDSKCIIFGLNDELKPIGTNGEIDTAFTTPSNFKTRAFFYPDFESCSDLDPHISDFISHLFWVLEHKRQERSREKVDKVALLQAPFEKKDFVGLDLESRTNRKRCVGRMTKHLGDLSLQCGLIQEALSYYLSATEILRSVNDWLWLGASLEGQAAASSIFLYPHLNRTYAFQRNSSLQDGSPVKSRTSSITTNSLPSGATPLSNEPIKRIASCLPSSEISKYYREAITHYSKVCIAVGWKRFI